MPGERRPALDQIVDEVLGRLRTNPLAAGVRFDRADVTRLVRRHYLGVEPWPFAALLADDPCAGPAIGGR
jgi:hypothetical protein